MEKREERLLAALVGMVRQYLNEDADGIVDTLCMSAGENAIDVLAEYGLMEVISPTGRIGRWTKAGDAFWESH